MFKEKSDAIGIIALVTSDEVRGAIVSVLDGSDLAMTYQKLKNQTEALVNRKISNGSFNWHLKMLEAGGVMSKKPVEGFSLTDDGKRIVSQMKWMLERIERRR